MPFIIEALDSRGQVLVARSLGCINEEFLMLFREEGQRKHKKHKVFSTGGQWRNVEYESFGQIPFNYKECCFSCQGIG